MESDESVVGKWIDEPCEKKNLVVCQRMQTWSMVRMQKTLLDSRKESRDALDEANKKITKLEQMLESEKASSSKSINDLKQILIPIGFIYPQLPNEKSPSEIWPTMTWTDVSAAYAGVFFRVNGGGSESFGQTQEENDRTLVRVENTYDGESVFRTSSINTTNQSTKTSEWLYTGIDHSPSTYRMYVRFVARTGEVRPRNMAMRVWKRTG